MFARLETCRSSLSAMWTASFYLKKELIVHLIWNTVPLLQNVDFLNYNQKPGRVISRVSVINLNNTTMMSVNLPKENNSLNNWICDEISVVYSLSSWLKIRIFVGKTNWSKHWPCSWAFLGSPIDGCLAKGVVCRSVRNCLRRQRGCSDSASGFPEFGWCGWNSCHCCCDWHRHRHSQGQRSISC